jgi:hypothetical protein
MTQERRQRLSEFFRLPRTIWELLKGFGGACVVIWTILYTVFSWGGEFRITKDKWSKVPDNLERVYAKEILTGADVADLRSLVRDHFEVDKAKDDTIAELRDELVNNKNHTHAKHIITWR